MGIYLAVNLDLGGRCTHEGDEDSGERNDKCPASHGAWTCRPTKGGGAAGRFQKREVGALRPQTLAPELSVSSSQGEHQDALGRALEHVKDVWFGGADGGESAKNLLNRQPNSSHAVDFTATFSNQFLVFLRADSNVRAKTPKIDQLRD
eukprot:484197-Pelagomonas_calceolata.AAC.9